MKIPGHILSLLFTLVPLIERHYQANLGKQDLAVPLLIQWLVQQAVFAAGINSSTANSFHQQGGSGQACKKRENQAFLQF